MPSVATVRPCASSVSSSASQASAPPGRGWGCVLFRRPFRRRRTLQAACLRGRACRARRIPRIRGRGLRVRFCEGRAFAFFLLDLRCTFLFGFLQFFALFAVGVFVQDVHVADRRVFGRGAGVVFVGAVVDRDRGRVVVELVFAATRNPRVAFAGADLVGLGGGPGLHAPAPGGDELAFRSVLDDAVVAAVEDIDVAGGLAYGDRAGLGERAFAFAAERRRVSVAALGQRRRRRARAVARALSTWRWRASVASIWGSAGRLGGRCGSRLVVVAGA